MKSLNKQFYSLLLPLLLTATGCQKQKCIVILHDNDVHCDIAGYLPLSGYKQAILAADTAYVATVSSGDFLQGGSMGGFSRGSFIVDMMNAVGYDVVTLGNHEFDYGLDRMQEMLDSLDSDVVLSNLTLPGEQTTLYAGYTVKQMGDTKIGYVGVTTPGAAISESYTFFDKEGHPLLDLHEDEVGAMIQQSVDKARAEGADYVILLSHLGESPVLSKVCSYDLIPQLRGIDVVFDGHTHMLIPEQYLTDADGRKVLLTQTGTRFSHIGQLTIWPDGTMKAECRERADFEKYADPHTQQVYDSITNEVADFMERSLTHSPYLLMSNDAEGNRLVRCKETNLGDLIADALRSITGAQVGLMNGGGIRSNLGPGDVKYISVNDVLPFANELVTLQLSGQEIIDLLEWSSRFAPKMDGSFLQVSGLRYTVDTRIHNHYTIDPEQRLHVEGKRRVKVEVELPNGKWEPINPREKFVVATIGFITGSGTNYPTLAHAIHLQDNIMTDIECFNQYLHMLGEEIPEDYSNPHGSGRIKILR